MPSIMAHTKYTFNKYLLPSLLMWLCYRTDGGAGAGVDNIPLWKGPSFPLWGSPQPTRFTLPTAREKTSLNARDWRKGKELFI